MKVNEWARLKKILIRLHRRLFICWRQEACPCRHIDWLNCPCIEEINEKMLKLMGKGANEFRRMMMKGNPLEISEEARKAIEEGAEEFRRILEKR